MGVRRPRRHCRGAGPSGQPLGHPLEAHAPSARSGRRGRFVVALLARMDESPEHGLDPVQLLQHLFEPAHLDIAERLGRQKRPTLHISLKLLKLLGFPAANGILWRCPGRRRRTQTWHTSAPRVGLDIMRRFGLCTSKFAELQVNAGAEMRSRRRAFSGSVAGRRPGWNRDGGTPAPGVPITSARA